MFSKSTLIVLLVILTVALACHPNGKKHKHGKCKHGGGSTEADCGDDYYYYDDYDHSHHTHPKGGGGKGGSGSGSSERLSQVASELATF
ncbi:unnamed protein product [Heligmosomoides polygyrus]|uniref:Secreted protein n=1 Tax=Heligmosomoides polygyrus TaxID=6339 RepID=A0A183FKP0_HELPZ|nr:unnamed protein product [Heligmosomoides polygyrus]